MEGYRDTQVLFQEFREDVIQVTRSREPDVRSKDIAADRGGAGDHNAARFNSDCDMRTGGKPGSRKSHGPTGCCSAGAGKSTAAVVCSRHCTRAAKNDCNPEVG